MSQTRLQSLAETVASTAIGFVVAYAATWAVFPAFGYPVTHTDNLWITTIFTAISLLRGWMVRRLFNHLHRSRT